MISRDTLGVTHPVDPTSASILSDPLYHRRLGPGSWTTELTMHEVGDTQILRINVNISRYPCDSFWYFNVEDVYGGKFSLRAYHQAYHMTAPYWELDGRYDMQSSSVLEALDTAIAWFYRHRSLSCDECRHETQAFRDFAGLSDFIMREYMGPEREPDAEIMGKMFNEWPSSVHSLGWKIFVAGNRKAYKDPPGLALRWRLTFTGLGEMLRPICVEYVSHADRTFYLVAPIGDPGIGDELSLSWHTDTRIARDPNATIHTHLDRVAEIHGGTPRQLALRDALGSIFRRLLRYRH